MSISAIGSSGLSASSLYGVSSTSDPFQFTNATTASATQQSSGPSRFASAISDAFAQLGISLDGTTTASATSGTSSTSTTDDGSDAVTAFVQSLLAALHGQAAGSAPPPPADGTVQASGTGHAHHGHGGRLEADLQSLIQDLGSTSSTTTPSTDAASTDTTTVDATATTGTDTSSDSTLATLEKSFDALLAQSGVSSSSTATGETLTAFLQTLAAKLEGVPRTGNVVSTAA